MFGLLPLDLLLKLHFAADTKALHHDSVTSVSYCLKCEVHLSNKDLLAKNNASTVTSQIKMWIKQIQATQRWSGSLCLHPKPNPPVPSSSPPSIPSSSQRCVCVSRGSRLTPDPGLMRAITRIKRGWLEGVWEWGLNNYTGLPTCLSSWLRKLQSPSLSPPYTLSVGTQKKGLMENNKLSRGHVNLDVNRRAIMF